METLIFFFKYMRRATGRIEVDLSHIKGLSIHNMKTKVQNFINDKLAESDDIYAEILKAKKSGEIVKLFEN